MTLLKVKDLTVRAGNPKRGSEKLLCEALSVTFRGGENWAILGANGSGKTTLLHTLAGLHASSSGKITLNNKDIKTWPPRQRARQMGILFQQQDTAFPASVMETVLTGRHPHMADNLWQRMWQWESHDDMQCATAALQAVGLGNFPERMVTTLSGGERQRVEIATILAQDPPICLLDEPNNNLDLKHQVQMLALLARRALDAKRLNIFVLHDINLALRFCSHGVLLFSHGRHHHGPLSEIINTDILEQLYGCAFWKLADTNGTVYMPV